MMQAVVQDGDGDVQVHVLVDGQVAADSVERFDVAALMFEEEAPVYGEYRRLARELAQSFVALEVSQALTWIVEE